MRCLLKTPAGEPAEFCLKSEWTTYWRVDLLALRVDVRHWEIELFWTRLRVRGVGLRAGYDSGMIGVRSLVEEPPSSG